MKNQQQQQQQQKNEKSLPYKHKTAATKESSSNSDAFVLDSKLIHLFQTRLNDLRQNENLFASKMKINIDLQPHDAAIEKNIIGEDDDENELLSYSFDVKFQLSWPHFLPKASSHQQITFSRTQIHVEHKIKNLTIQNPSNSNVQMQIILMNGFVC